MKVSLLFLTLLFTTLTFAQPGSLDHSFGSNGTVYMNGTTFGDVTIQAGRSIAVQNDGKIIAVGNAYNQQIDPANPYYPLVAILRFNHDGTLDHSFGNDGATFVDPTEFGRNTGTVALNVVITPFGRITVTAQHSEYVPSENSNVDYTTVIQLLDNGDVNNSFSGNGILNIKLGNSAERSWGITALSDNSILINGSALDALGATALTVTHINTDGTLDANFGNNGHTSINADFTTMGYGISVQPDGKILACGQVNHESGASDLVVARLLSDGSPDASFGTNGVATFDGGDENEQAYDVLPAPNGKIAVIGMGYHDGAPQDFNGHILRLNSDGSLDASFNGTGKVLIDDGPQDLLNAGAVQSNGKIIFIGKVTNDQFSSSGNYLRIGRLNEDGTLDQDFGYGFNDAFTVQGIMGMDCAIQPDGKIAVVADNYSLFRFLGGEPNVTWVLDKDNDGTGLHLIARGTGTVNRNKGNSVE